MYVIDFPYGMFMNKHKLHQIERMSKYTVEQYLRNNTFIVVKFHRYKEVLHELFYDLWCRARCQPALHEREFVLQFSQLKIVQLFCGARCSIITANIDWWAIAHRSAVLEVP